MIKIHIYFILDLHRGCSYGMDLGQIQVENGCFVEEEGSTYCFCDFNRCNAAGILDLRNLIDSSGRHQQHQTTYEPFLAPTTTTSKRMNQSAVRVSQYDNFGNQPLRLLDNLEIERDGFIELNRYPIGGIGGGGDEEPGVGSTTTTAKTTTTTVNWKTTSPYKPHTILPTSAYLSTLALNMPNITSPAVHSSVLSGVNKASSNKNVNKSMITTTAKTTSFPFNVSTAFPFKTSYDPVLNNLDQLLIDYLNFSKSVNSYLITESIRQQIIKR